MARMDGETLVSNWHIEDVLDRDEGLTRTQCVAVLKLLADTHDCNIGINWEVIDMAIDKIKGEQHG